MEKKEYEALLSLKKLEFIQQIMAETSFDTLCSWLEMPRRALHLVFERLDLHKDELMENWERMENGETLAKINPLD